MDYGYDDLYRLTRETIWKRDAANDFAIARRIDYSYDSVGNRERMTVTHDDLNSNGPCVTESVTTYAYDANDRLTSSTTTVTPLSPVAQARFNDYYAGRPKGWTRWVVLAFASVSLAAFFAPLLMPYGRRLGRRARRQRIRTACVAAFFVPLMAVDPQTVDALTTEALRAQAAIAAGIPLDCEEQPTTTVTYGYDANGNQTTRTTQRDGNTTVETFIFDVENRLVGYRKSENGSQVHAASASYTYDADGVRTSKTVSSQATLYTTDKNRPYAQVLEEREAKTGDLLVRYTYGDDLISQTRPQTGSADVTRYYHCDGQMSTRHLTDDSTIATSVTTTDRYTYDAFGNDIGSDGTTINAYRYTGEQFDEAVGQYYLRARYYDQGVGRFASRDPFVGIESEPVTLHKYSYAKSNPVTFADPGGLEASLVGQLNLTSINGILSTYIIPNIKQAAWSAGISFLVDYTLLGNGLWTSFKSALVVGATSIAGGAAGIFANNIMKFLRAGKKLAGIGRLLLEAFSEGTALAFISTIGVIADYYLVSKKPNDPGLSFGQILGIFVYSAAVSYVGLAAQKGVLKKLLDPVIEWLDEVDTRMWKKFVERVSDPNSEFGFEAYEEVFYNSETLQSIVTAGRDSLSGSLDPLIVAFVEKTGAIGISLGL